MTAGGIIVGGEASGQRFLPVPAPAGHPPPCGTLTDSVTRGTLDVMKNKVIAKRFESIAGMLEIKGESPFRVDACHNAARTLAEPATDAHATGTLGMMRFGVAVARRAWVEPSHVINTWTLEKLLDGCHNGKP